MIYHSRLVEPEVDNKNYIKTTYNGYNKCVLKNSETGSCLPNCVGYAWGRWREILNKDPRLSVGNAGYWYVYTQDGYKRGQAPKLGSVICQIKSGTTSYEGHVAIVERIYSNGDLVISQSASGGAYYEVLTLKASENYRYKSDSYKLQGFIYLPDEYTSIIDEFKIGDKVKATGPIYSNSMATKKAGKVTNKESTITRKVPDALHNFTIENIGQIDGECFVIDGPVTPPEPVQPTVIKVLVDTNFYKATEELPLRRSGQIFGRKICMINKDDTVEFIGGVSGGWIRITYKGFIGWASKKYLENIKEEKEVPVSQA